MRIIEVESVAEFEMSDLEEKVNSIIIKADKDGRSVIDVDFLIDDSKIMPYRAFIKYGRGAN